MASGSITSWQIGRQTIETVKYFILGGSKITADSDCNHEAKRHLLLGRKAMNDNPLQYSCLENPIDRGAWPTTVHRVAKSRTRLKRLNMHSLVKRTRITRLTSCSSVHWRKQKIKNKSSGPQVPRSNSASIT